MKKGFFSASKTQTKTNLQLSNSPACGRCKLYKDCATPKMPPTGNGNVPVLHISEYPSAAEDRAGEQLTGQAGQFYKRILKQLGHDITEATKTNAVICNIPKDKELTKAHIKYCHPNLVKTIQSIQPKLIIPLGDAALRSLIQHKFSNEIGSLTKWRGNLIPDREYNTWICPTFHPSYVIRDKTSEVVELIFKQDLKQALRMLDFPLPNLKPETECVEILKHPKTATNWVRDLFKTKRMIAFDYETTGLKPQSFEQQIKCVSICAEPDHVVSFQFFNDFDFIDVFRHVMETPSIKKICANIKFEKDWTETKLSPTKLGGVFFDTMIAAHYLDNRSGITGLKHQVYVNFGTPEYNAHISKFLESDESKGGNTVNNIDKIDVRDLLVYCGIDSLCEFRLALVQMDLLGMDYGKYYSGVSGKEMLPHLFAIREN